MKTYGALARGVALMQRVEKWTEADWYDDETGILAMKDGRRYRELREGAAGPSVQPAPKVAP